MLKLTQWIPRCAIELAIQLCKTVLRFISRKNCEGCLANRKILSREKCNFHAGTKVFVNENLTPINDTISYNLRELKRSDLILFWYYKHGFFHNRNNEASRPMNVFHLGKLFSFIPNHFWNNSEHEQYHDVSIDKKQLITIIKLISLFRSYLMICLIFISELLVINWVASCQIRKTFVLPGCPMSFALRRVFLAIFKTCLPTRWMDIFSIFLYCQRWK